MLKKKAEKRRAELMMDKIALRKLLSRIIIFFLTRVLSFGFPKLSPFLKPL